MEININELVKIEQMAIIKQQLNVVSEEIEKKLAVIPDTLNEISKLPPEEQEEKKQDIKKYKAYLNNILKQLEEKRKEVKKKINEPYDEFNSYYEEKVKISLTNGINQLDSTINDIETKQINEKQEEILEFINEYIVNNHLENILNNDIVIEYAGLKINLSNSIKSLKEKALSFISKVSDEIKLIDMEEQPSLLLYEYTHNGYDLTKAKLTIIEKQKQIEKLAKQREKIQEEEKQEEVIEERNDEIVTQPKKIVEEKLTVAFTIIATKEEVKEVKRFLEERNIKYE